MKLKTATIGLAAIATLATPALAEYPERTIELTIPAGAGGGTDTSARKLAILLEEALGTSIAILNVGGGRGLAIHAGQAGRLFPVRHMEQPADHRAAGPERGLCAGQLHPHRLDL